MKKVGIIETHKPKPGFIIAIEVRGSIFNLRNFYEEETRFNIIDIFDINGKYVDEFASGFSIDPTGDPADYELSLMKVFEYIDENLIF